MSRTNTESVNKTSPESQNDEDELSAYRNTEVEIGAEDVPLGKLKQISIRVNHFDEIESQNRKFQFKNS